MSTRATYQFIGGDYEPTVTLYIHHDGYEAGAAYYFYNAFRTGGALTAETMIRGNDRAEITASHDAHGDTEYRYTLQRDGKLTVEARIEFGSYPEGWRTVYRGDWIEFVNRHIDPDWLDHEFKPLKRLQLRFGSEIHTPDTLQAKLDEDLRLLGRWTLNGSSESANFRQLARDADIMLSTITGFGSINWSKHADCLASGDACAECQHKADT